MADDSVNLQILLMARQLVINGHTDRRADLHNQWLVDSAALWASHRQRLAYPPIPPYPTEAEIVARARALLEFVHSDSTINPVTVARALDTAETSPSVEPQPDSVLVTAAPPAAAAVQTSASVPDLRLELVPVDNPLPISDYSEEFRAQQQPDPADASPVESARSSTLMQQIDRLRSGWKKS
jgi:hypothetical protein